MAYNYLTDKFTNLTTKSGNLNQLHKIFQDSLTKVWKLVLKGKILIPRVNTK